MIKLHKTVTPQILQDRGAEWTATIVNKLAANETLTQAERTRYRHPQIKQALVEETHGKCAYCESKLLHIHHGDVEHICPKSLVPERTVEWGNLTLACEICNQNKSDRDPRHDAIIDPYVTEPSIHLLFSGALVFPKGTAEGSSTRALLDLNRGELAERRKEHLEKLMGIFDTISRTDLPIATRKAIFQDLLAREASSAEAYSAMAASAIEQMRKALPAEVIE